MFKIRGVVALIGLLAFLLAACWNPSGRNTESDNPSPEVAPMPARSPIMAGPIIYLALGDSTGSGVGATEGGYVARLFKRIQLHRPGFLRGRFSSVGEGYELWAQRMWPTIAATLGVEETKILK